MMSRGYVNKVFVIGENTEPFEAVDGIYITDEIQVSTIKKLCRWLQNPDSINQQLTYIILPEK